MMTEAEQLKEKIQAYLAKQEQARKDRDARRAKSSDHAKGLFAEIDLLLKGFDGITVSMMDLDLPLEGDWLEINLLGRSIRFSTLDREEDIHLEVSGLYDRTLEFKLQPDLKWTADDERSSTPITYSEKLLLKRLAALVPD